MGHQMWIPGSTHSIGQFWGLHMGHHIWISATTHSTGCLQPWGHGLRFGSQGALTRLGTYSWGPQSGPTREPSDLDPKEHSLDWVPTALGLQSGGLHLGDQIWILGSTHSTGGACSFGAYSLGSSTWAPSREYTNLLFRVNLLKHFPVRDPGLGPSPLIPLFRRFYSRGAPQCRPMGLFRTESRGAADIAAQKAGHW